MLLIEPDPFYLLLEETEIATTSASAIGSRLTIHLERNFLIIRWYSYSTIPQQPEDIFLYKHLVVIYQRE
ncbi:unknown [Segatella copri CAG:164]|nr:unknown [Segatella copri CAG:164]